MTIFNKIYRYSRLWILVIIAFLLPSIVTNNYFLHVANLAMMFAILTLSLNILSGCTGLMSVGHIAFYGIGAYTSAILTTRFGWPIGLGILAAGVMAALGCLVMFVDRMRVVLF